MDDILPNSKNFTNTECGHCFHTSCLMTNVVHNGFGCPYCREKMVEEPEENNEDLGSEISYITQEDETRNEAFTSMRMLFQRTEGEELEEEENPQEPDEEEPEEEPVPPVDMIMRKLIGQGITYEDLVKHILLEHDEYSFDEEFDAIADNVFATVRISITKYNETTPETEREPEPEPRFKHVFTTSPMPDFASMTIEELKTICRDYGIRYRRQRVVASLTTVWEKHNSQPGEEVV